MTTRSFYKFCRQNFDHSFSSPPRLSICRLLPMPSQNSRYTDALFPLYKPLFPELLARWTAATSSQDVNQIITTISCLARVLPFATYLRPHVKSLLQTERLKSHLLDLGNHSSGLDDNVVHSLLLALFRILSFDRDMLTENVGPLFLSSFLHDKSFPVRYLAVHCLCMVMHFADAYSEKLIQIYVGKEVITGEWEGKKIDYRLLKLWEERRWKDLARLVANVEQDWRSVSAHSSNVRMSVCR